MTIAPGAFTFDDDHTTRAWLATVWFMFAAIVATTPAYLVDSRTLWEISVWSKPLKFELSMMIHFATLAILAQQLPRSKRAGIFMTGVVWMSVAAALMEIVYITLQAARGRHSHFNFDTAYESAMYSVMGLGALLLIFAAFALGVMLAVHRDGDRSGFRLGAVVGLLLSPVLTFIVAGYMSTSGSHWVGMATSDANGVPIAGWSLQVGDLRPSHFVALHAMQALPIVGLVADRITPRFARGGVIVAAAAITIVTMLLFMQALAGNPLY
jgi:hypothetical protein